MGGEGGCCGKFYGVRGKRAVSKRKSGNWVKIRGHRNPDMGTLSPQPPHNQPPHCSAIASATPRNVLLRILGVR